MARPKKNKAAAPVNDLLTALQFVGSVLQEKGTVCETHILLSNNWAVAFNGIIAAGAKIQSPLFAAPNYALLVAALSKCKEYEIESIGSSLVVKGGKFKAIIPCIDPVYINVSGIDPNTVPINDEFKKGLEITGALANENGQTIHYASILLNGQSLVSTENGVMVFEYWHGCDLPTNIAVPKALVAPLAKTNKKLVGFGFSQSSITVYFDDDSWLKSQLYAEKYPDITGILNLQSNPSLLPKDLWEAIEAVEKFSPDGLLHSKNKKLHSHSLEELGASYECFQLSHDLTFSAKQLLRTKEWAKEIDWFAPLPNGGTCIKIFGDRVRGVIAGRNQ